MEEEVRKTLASLDRVDRVAPKPFLFTRIMGRMQQSGSESSKWKQPFYRLTVALLALLVVINVVTVSLNLSGALVANDDTDQEEQYFEQYYPALTTIENLQIDDYD